VPFLSLLFSCVVALFVTLFSSVFVHSYLYKVQLILLLKLHYLVLCFDLCCKSVCFVLIVSGSSVVISWLKSIVFQWRLCDVNYMLFPDILSLYHNCNLTTIWLQYDCDENWRSFFAHVEQKQRVRYVVVGSYCHSRIAIVIMALCVFLCMTSISHIICRKCTLALTKLICYGELISLAHN